MSLFSDSLSDSLDEGSQYLTPLKESYVTGFSSKMTPFYDSRQKESPGHA